MSTADPTTASRLKSFANTVNEPLFLLWLKENVSVDEILKQAEQKAKSGKYELVYPVPATSRYNLARLGSEITAYGFDVELSPANETTTYVYLRWDEAMS